MEDDTIRTTVRDSILSNVSGDLDADAVCGVEWAAVDDTVAAVRRRDDRLPGHAALVDFEAYREVAL